MEGKFQSLSLAVVAMLTMPTDAMAFFLACARQGQEGSPVLLEVEPELKKFAKIGEYGLDVMRWEFDSVKVTDNHIEAFFKGAESQQPQRWLINRITGFATLELGERPVGLGTPMKCEKVTKKF